MVRRVALVKSLGVDGAGRENAVDMPWSPRSGVPLRVPILLLLLASLRVSGEERCSGQSQGCARTQGRTLLRPPQLTSMSRHRSPPSDDE